MVSYHRTKIRKSIAGMVDNVNIDRLDMVVAVACCNLVGVAVACCKFVVGVVAVLLHLGVGKRIR